MRKPKPLGESALFDYAVRALGGRGHSIGQLRDKLRGRAEVAGDVDVVLKRLKEIGYLDDKRFAENYTAAKLGGAGLGRMRVLNDLRQRRVAPTLAETVVTEAYKETDEISLIEAWLERKYRAKNLREWLGEEKNLASAYRRLRTAGFSSGNSIKTLKRYATQAEQLEDFETEPEL
jgi:regulatory protein